jgi:hypothetical protein
MSIREELAEEHGDDLLFLDETIYDSAILGVVYQCNNALVCYSIDDIIDILIEEDNMEEEEAIEYFHFNMVGAYVGEKTPVFLSPSRPYL